MPVGLYCDVTRKRSDPAPCSDWRGKVAGDWRLDCGRYRMLEPVWTVVIIKHYRTEYGAAKHCEPCQA